MMFNYRISVSIISSILLSSLTLPLSVLAQAKHTDNKNSDSTYFNAKDILTGNTPVEKEYMLRRHNFISNLITDLLDSNRSDIEFQSYSDGLFGANSLRGLTLSSSDPVGYLLQLLEPEEILRGLVPSSSDPLRHLLQPEEIHTMLSIPINPIVRYAVNSLKKKPNSLKDKNLPVPTDREIEILKFLWVEKEATSRKMYAELDSSVTIFAEELYAVLESMVYRGFLGRRQVSPSNDLDFLGTAMIEMSSKNRKNKVYLYWPIVTREKLFTYLDAKRYLTPIESKDVNDYDLQGNDYQDNYRKNLEKKLYRLFQ